MVEKTVVANVEVARIVGVRTVVSDIDQQILRTGIGVAKGRVAGSIAQRQSAPAGLPAVERIALTSTRAAEQVVVAFNTRIVIFRWCPIRQEAEHA